MNDIPIRLCACGCGEITPICTHTVKARGLVKGQRIEYVHGHNRRKSASEYLIDPGTGCWIWQRARAYARGGYGVAYDGKKPRDAHRVVWERENGPIPEGMQLHHLCENPPCVNPGHLQLLSKRDHSRITRAPRTRLTWEIVREIRGSGETGRALAARYGVTEGHVSAIRKQKCWRE